jgi:hypothetical protein
MGALRESDGSANVINKHSMLGVATAATRVEKTALPSAALVGLRQKCVSGPADDQIKADPH